MDLRTAHKMPANHERDVKRTAARGAHCGAEKPRTNGGISMTVRVMTRVRKALLMPFPCRWNGWVRHYTAEVERLVWLARGGERGFRRRFCRDFGVCLDNQDQTA